MRMAQTMPRSPLSVTHGLARAGRMRDAPLPRNSVTVAVMTTMVGLGLCGVATRCRRLARQMSCKVAAVVALPATEEQKVQPQEGLASGAGVHVKRQGLQFERHANGQLRSLMVTTPLFYANAPPHIGSAYPTIACDVIARYARLQGCQVHFVTGMDEHGEKIAQTAAGRDQRPQELVDDIAAQFETLWDKLSVYPDHFVRTTMPKHRQIVAEMWHTCADKGDIYKKDYEGWYCVGCEAYLDEDEMLQGHICQIHQKPCIRRREDNYFFRLSKYWDQVVAHIKDNPEFILPLGRRNEVMLWLKDDNRRDFSISRASTSWGIPVPGDESQVIYVWFDALLGYITSLLQPGDVPTLETALKRGWPADIHIIGKDIIRFHAIYWPAILMSADLPLPKHIITHGFLTKDGLKMGKSLGNVVEPVHLVEAFGADAVRFFFAGCMSFGEDGDFSYEVFIKRVNSCLANELGNLVHRLLTLCRKNLTEPTPPKSLFDDGEVPSDHPVYKVAVAAPAHVSRHFENLDFPKAAQAALEIASAANIRITEVAPWAKFKAGSSDEDKRVALREMLVMAEGVRICAVLLSPLTPGLSGKILAELSVALAGGRCPQWSDTAWCWDALPGLASGSKPQPVFQRIDVDPWKGK